MGLRRAGSPYHRVEIARWYYQLACCFGTILAYTVIRRTGFPARENIHGRFCMSARGLFGFTALLLLITSGTTALGGWEAAYLSRAKSFNGHASSVSGGQQAGTFWLDGVAHASLWSGTPTSWVDVSPSGSTSSGIAGFSGGRQVGYADFSSRHAGMWSGTKTSFVDLHPAGYESSEANGISGNQQVGSAYFTSPGGSYLSHAGLWSGTAGSFVDLNPPSCTVSCALGVSGGQQVGSVLMYGTGGHAALWSGTAASYVDLNPHGSYLSVAYGVSNG